MIPAEHQKARLICYQRCLDALGDPDGLSHAEAVETRLIKSRLERERDTFIRHIEKEAEAVVKGHVQLTNTGFPEGVMMERGFHYCNQDEVFARHPMKGIILIRLDHLKSDDEDGLIYHYSEVEI